MAGESLTIARTIREELDQAGYALQRELYRILPAQLMLRLIHKSDSAKRVALSLI